MRTLEDFISLANDLLATYEIGRRIHDISDCSPSMFVVLFESMFSYRLQHIVRQPSKAEDHIHNATELIAELERKLQLRLVDHIQPQKLHKRDLVTTCKLIDVFAEMAGISTFPIDISAASRRQQLTSDADAGRPLFVSSVNSPVKKKQRSRLQKSSSESESGDEDMLFSSGLRTTSSQNQINKRSVELATCSQRESCFQRLSQNSQQRVPSAVLHESTSTSAASDATAAMRQRHAQLLNQNNSLLSTGMNLASALNHNSTILSQHAPQTSALSNRRTVISSSSSMTSTSSSSALQRDSIRNGFQKQSTDTSSLSEGFSTATDSVSSTGNVLPRNTLLLSNTLPARLRTSGSRKLASSTSSAFTLSTSSLTSSERSSDSSSLSSDSSANRKPQYIMSLDYNSVPNRESSLSASDTERSVATSTSSSKNKQQHTQYEPLNQGTNERSEISSVAESMKLSSRSSNSGRASSQRGNQTVAESNDNDTKNPSVQQKHSNVEETVNNNVNDPNQTNDNGQFLFDSDFVNIDTNISTRDQSTSCIRQDGGIQADMSIRSQRVAWDPEINNPLHQEAVSKSDSCASDSTQQQNETKESSLSRKRKLKAKAKQQHNSDNSTEQSDVTVEDLCDGTHQQFSSASTVPNRRYSATISSRREKKKQSILRRNSTSNKQPQRDAVEAPRLTVGDLLSHLKEKLANQRIVNSSQSAQANEDTQLWDGEGVHRPEGLDNSTAPQYIDRLKRALQQIRNKDILDKEKRESELAEKRNRTTEKLDWIRLRNFEAEQERLLRATAINRRSKEEMAVKQVYEQVIRSEKERVIYERGRLKEYERKMDAKVQLRKEQITNYYQDQISMLEEQLGREQQERRMAEKAQKLALEKLEREIREKRWKELHTLRDRIQSESEARYHRAFNPEKVANGLIKRMTKK